MAGSRAKLLVGLAWLVVEVGCGGLRPLNSDDTDSGDTSPDDTTPDDTTPDDTTPDDTTPDDTSPQGPVAPTLVSFTARAVSGQIELTFRVTDPDNDLNGGAVEITRDGQVETRALPGGVDVWNPSGDSRIFLDMSGCGSQNVQLSLRVRDSGSRWSSSRNANVTASGGGFAVSETGDDELTAADVGAIYPPMTICGDLYAASNDSQGYTGDLDWLTFDAGSTGNWTFELTWANAAADYDFYLLDDWGFEVASSLQDGSAQPERIQAQVFSGDFYYLVVAGWSGGGGAWTVSVQ